MTTSGSKTETYAYTKATAAAVVVPRVVTQSEQVARYFTEDLTYFLQETGINLLDELHIPTEYAHSNREALEMLYDDLAHMLRDQLITGIQLLLAEPKLDPNTHAYPLRYHAMYLVEMPARGAQAGGSAQEMQARRLGGYLAPPRQSWVGARFALLIDWNRSATERRLQARRPEYCFDWVTGGTRYDATTLIRYREGGLTSEGAQVVRRSEAKSPGF
jgi:hypothetical protein